MSELWPNGPEYEGGGAFPITTDSVLLADFVRLRPGLRVFEPCSGAGLISLLLLAREPRLDVYALELDGAACEAARRNFAANGFRADVVCGDLRDAANLPAANSCGLAVCNPPYFPAGSGRTAPDGRRALARSEGGCTLADVVRAAARTLRQGGRFALVHRAERLAELFAALQAHGLEPKRLQLVQHGPDRPPSAALVEAVRQGRPGLAVLPTLLNT